MKKAKDTQLFKDIYIARVIHEFFRIMDGGEIEQGRLPDFGDFLSEYGISRSTLYTISEDAPVSNQVKEALIKLEQATNELLIANGCHKMNYKIDKI